MPTRYPLETFDTLPPELAYRETSTLLEYRYLDGNARDTKG